MMRLISRIVSLFAIVCLLSAPALAQYNGIVINPRVFDDFSTSTLTITNSNSIPGNVTIDDRNLVDDGMGGNFANRHDAVLSRDGGATAYNHAITEPFSISTNVNMAVGVNAPRKESGLRINSPVTGDTLFIVNSDAGEIVAFGGGAPFHLFGSNANSNGYTPGTTILLGMTYTPGSPGTIEYFINRGAGIESSGPLAYSNLEGGPENFQVGMYAQVAPASGQDFITTRFENINAIPEPATAGLALAGLLALRRVRRGR